MKKLMSRGLRNAPVKTIRSRCSVIAATNTSAAQWWVWRISSPPVTSKERSSVEAYAAETVWPGERRDSAVVDGLDGARVEEQREERARARSARGTSRARSRRAGSSSGRGRRSPAGSAGRARRRGARRRSGPRRLRAGCSARRIASCSLASPTRRARPARTGDRPRRSAPDRVDRQRQLRQRPSGGTELDAAAVEHVEGRVVARTDERRPRDSVVGLSGERYSETAQPACVQIFEYARIPSRRPATPAPAGSRSVAGSTRTTTTGEPRSSLSAPSGKAVRKLPSLTSAARIGLPSSSTSARPARQGVSLSCVLDARAERDDGDHDRRGETGACDARRSPEQPSPRDPVEAAARAARLTCGAAVAVAVASGAPRPPSPAAPGTVRRRSVRRRAARAPRRGTARAAACPGRGRTGRRTRGLPARRAPSSAGTATLRPVAGAGLPARRVARSPARAHSAGVRAAHRSARA